MSTRFTDNVVGGVALKPLKKSHDAVIHQPTLSTKAPVAVLFPYLNLGIPNINWRVRLTKSLWVPDTQY